MNERMIQWLRRLLLCAATVICPLSIVHCLAQEDMSLRQICSQAESNMQIGRTDEARDTLLLHMNAFKGTLKRDALRMIAMSYLTDYDEQKAGEYVKMMLEVDPYYSVTTFDPPIFVDIVNKLKAGKTVMVTTASNMEESLDEVPVPTTLITEEMIRSCGGRNLQEVLAAYVPSMNLIDCNDGINIAMRGIYGNTQEMILIMLNGHRLNSYLTNAASPDFSISLEKVKQIEVLRGPASSVYGGVALTAVVNIITKEGADVDGTVVKTEAGNYRQLRGDVLMGKRYYGLDVMAWVSGYSCKGEQRTVSEEQMGGSTYGEPIDHITIGRVGSPPTYDLGVQLKLKGWQLLYNTNFSQVVAPYTFAMTAKSYNYEKYRTINSLAPGFTTNAHHADLRYQFTIRDARFTVGANYDKMDVTQYQVLSEDPNKDLVRALFGWYGVQTLGERGGIDCGGLSRYLNGQEETYGLRVKADYDYSLGKTHKGSLAFGAEYEHFHLADMNFLTCFEYDLTFIEIPSTYANIFKGHENAADVSLQWKHQWRSLILNAGLRYDYKKRTDDTEANELSPRVALIWLHPRWNVRLSYSKSFVDSPYYYRRSNFGDKIINGMGMMFAEVEPLEPERIHSWQVSVAAKQWVKGLNVEVNGFLNKASDLVMPTMQEYVNGGKNHTVGVELSADYQRPRFTANMNLTWTHNLRSNVTGSTFDNEENEKFKPSNIDTNNNTPAIVSNTVLAWQATPHLKLHGHLLVESKQTSYNFDMMKYQYLVQEIIVIHDYTDEELKAMYDAVIAKYDIPARAIVNVGADYKIGKLTLGLNIHNLFDTRYDRSGMNTNLVPQQGRWWTVSASYKF